MAEYTKVGIRDEIHGLEVLLSHSTHEMKTENKNTKLLILLHGFWCNLTIWVASKWFKYICKKDLHVCAINFPGHSNNPHGQLSLCNDLHFSDCVEKTGSVIDYFGNKNTIVIGFSFGGLVAQAVTKSNDLVTKQVLISSCAPRRFPFDPSNTSFGFIKQSMFPVMAGLQAIVGILAGVSFDLTSKAKEYATNRLKPELREAILESLQEESGTLGRQMITGIQLAEVTDKPTLVIAGGRDRLIPSSTQMRLVRLYNADYLYRASAGHIIMGSEDSEDALTKILDWI